MSIWFDCIVQSINCIFKMPRAHDDVMFIVLLRQDVLKYFQEDDVIMTSMEIKICYVANERKAECSCH